MIIFFSSYFQYNFFFHALKESLFCLPFCTLLLHHIHLSIIHPYRVSFTYAPTLYFAGVSHRFIYLLVRICGYRGSNSSWWDAAAGLYVTKGAFVASWNPRKEGLSVLEGREGADGGRKRDRGTEGEREGEKAWVVLWEVYVFLFFRWQITNNSYITVIYVLQYLFRSSAIFPMS